MNYMYCWYLFNAELFSMLMTIQAQQHTHRKPQHQTVHVRSPRARTMRSVNRNS